MATTKKPSFQKFMTPVGVAVFPKLTTPDTKFKADGEYAVKLRLSATDSEAFIGDIEKALKAYWPAAKAELESKVEESTGPAKAKAKKALAEMKEADKGYRPAYDDAGEETGEYEFNIKMPATYLKDKGKATEERKSMRPDVFDAKGKKLDKVPDIWGGSEMIVAGEFRPFNMAIGVGISLRLKAVQVIKLVQGGGDRDAGSYGFGKQAGGYEADDEPSMGDHAPAADSDAKDGAEDDQF